MQSDDITRVPAEFAPTELPPAELQLHVSKPIALGIAQREAAQLDTVEFLLAEPGTAKLDAVELETAKLGTAQLEETATTTLCWPLETANTQAGQAVTHATASSSSLKSRSLRWEIHRGILWSIRWGTIAIAATTITQTSLMLFTSLVLPIFLREIEQAKTSEAWLKISAMNQAQQVYFLDHGEFSEDLISLDLGLVSQGQYYDYQVQVEHRHARSRQQNIEKLNSQLMDSPGVGQPQAVPQHSQPQQVIVSLALPREPGLPMIWGAIAAEGGDRLTDSLICQKTTPKLHWSRRLRQQFQASARKSRSREAIPTVPLSLECPTGFTPTSFAISA